MLICLALQLISAIAQPDDSVFLIAHRGGIVDATHAENSPAAMRAAIERGYAMIEIDLKCSKDNVIFVHHDVDFLRVYGVKNKVADCTWKKIRKLKSKIGGEHPQSLADVAAGCNGKVRLMVDAKDIGASPETCGRIEQILRDNGLLDNAYFIGDAGVKAHFKGKARIAVNSRDLRRAAEAGETVDKDCFLFEEGKDMKETSVRYAQSLNVPVVASVNTLHYLGLSASRSPEADIKRLRALGVREFQIDAAYEQFLRP